MTATLVNIISVLLIGLIIYWFWIAKPATRHSVGGSVDILVDNGVYEPARIEVNVGQPITLRFTRKDHSPCAEKVVFADFGLTIDLPVDQTIDIKLQPENAGEYPFTCQMQMYRGMLVVK
ncbi:MAG: cupredoxin domain-containing protein [Gammaproteobacteria bacterium]|nr:cupredoxin domain-containing protein [Gammaproteobacteria bacterium]MDH5652544.1 cupredoxin domain-containing protein [Gammaproteobacteria bacterium]